MSDGEQTGSTTEPKKVHYTQKMKDEIEALKAHIRDLEAAPAAVSVADPASPPPVTTDGYDKNADPIGWMADEDEIYLVSTVTYLPSNLISTPPGLKAREVPEKLRAYAAKRWGNMPFKIQGRTREETENLEILLDKHWHHRVTRNYAERVFKSEWSEMPHEACVLPEDFTGHDYQNNPKGNKRPCSGDPVVEYVRHILQKLAGTIWIDYAYHSDHIPLREPNPYGKGRERFTTDPRTLKTATADGDLRADWEHDG